MRLPVIIISMLIVGAIAAAIVLGSARMNNTTEGEIMVPPFGLEQLAATYELEPDQIGSYDSKLCARLTMSGKVYVQRGRYLEAKQEFMRAILVDPSSAVAWKNYDMAVVGALSKRVEQQPGLIGLPDDESSAVNQEEPQEEEGC